jgi:hypothetical protein
MDLAPVLARRAASALVVGALLASGPAAAAPATVEREDRPTAGAMVADVAVARPLGVVMTGLGLAAWVVSMPFTVTGGNLNESAETLVLGPARETFARCLGCTRPGQQGSPVD